MQGVSSHDGGGQDEAHLRSLWNFLLRNRVLAFGIPALTVLATGLFVWLATPVYDATVWIRIDEERSNLPVLDALQDLSSGSQIGTEIQVLRRRPLAEEVIDSLQLQLEVTRPRGLVRSDLLADIEVSRDAPEGRYVLRRLDRGRFELRRLKPDSVLGEVEIGERLRLEGASAVLTAGAQEHEEIRLAVQEYNDAVKAFRRTIEVSQPDREADIVAVRYQGVDPVLVREVPNTMARFFIRQRQDVKKSEARGTVVFLTAQIDSLAAQLTEAEEEVRIFREGERIVSLEHEGQAHIERLAKLQAERDLLDAEREALAELLASVQRAAGEADEDVGGPSPYRRLIAFPSLLENFAVSELFRSLAEVENQRAELLNRRTPEDPDVQVLSGRMAELEDQLRYISVTYLEGLTNHVASLNASLFRFRDELGEVPAKEVQFARLERQAEVLNELYTLLQTRLHETQIVAAVDDPTVRVVEPASLPYDPIRPRRLLSLALAVVLGMVMGMGGAFVRENMDTTLYTREELQALLGEVPVLGVIPRIGAALGRRGRTAQVPKRAGGAVDETFESRLVAGRDPRNPISEAYRSLRTNISFSRMGEMPRTLVFTSPTPGDGKSTTASNLAITLAQQDLRCLLIDADLRRGFLNETFGTRREPGLSNVLLGRATVEDAIQSVDLGESGTLDFLPTGTLPPNPAELAASPQMQTLLEQLASTYEMVILDAPPLTLVTDAALLGTYADGVILVARAGRTERGAITYALEQIKAVRAPILGAVLNDVDQRKERYYGSYTAGAHADYYGTVS